MLNIKVVIGSTRPNRFSEKPARWIYEEVKKKDGVDAELLDLRDYPMPFFDGPIAPSAGGGKYSNEVVRRWADKITEGDAFIIVTPEYNHGYPAVLKNALDSTYPEWNRKAVGFVGYGAVGGARSIEQLRLVAIELQMVPIRNSIHISGEVYMAVMNESAPVNPELFKALRTGRRDRVEAFLSELIWTAGAMKSARETNH